MDERRYPGSLFAALWIVSSAFGCATRIQVPAAPPAEIASIEAEIGSSLTPADIEREQNERYWQLFLADPETAGRLPPELVDVGARDGTEKLHSVLSQAVRSSTGMSLIQASRVSAGTLRQLVADGRVRDGETVGRTADAVDALQAVVHRNIDAVGERVLEVSGRPGVRLQGTPVIGLNATVPVQFGANDIYVGTEMALLADSDDELACVVGHELAHLTEGHAEQGAWVELGKATLTTAATIAVLAALADTNHTLTPAQIQAALAMGSLTTFMLADVPLRLSGWDRAQEHDADAVGAYFVWKAGFDPRACASFMTRVAQAERAYGGDKTPRWWRTHPAGADRVWRLRQVADQLAQGRFPAP